MSDVNKIVAAILTAGRMPTKSATQNMDEWRSEFNLWVEVLENQDREASELAIARSKAEFSRSQSQASRAKERRK